MGLEQRFERCASLVSRVAALSAVPAPARGDVAGVPPSRAAVEQMCLVAVAQTCSSDKTWSSPEESSQDQLERGGPAAAAELGELLLAPDGVVDKVLRGASSDWGAVLVCTFTERLLVSDKAQRGTLGWCLRVFFQLVVRHGRRKCFDELVGRAFVLADDGARDSAVTSVIRGLDGEIAGTAVGDGEEGQDVSERQRVLREQTMQGWLSMFLKVPGLSLSRANVQGVCKLATDASSPVEAHARYLLTAVADLCEWHAAGVLDAYPLLLSDVVDWELHERAGAREPRALSVAHLVDVVAACDGCRDRDLRARLLAPVAQRADVWAVVKQTLAMRRGGALRKEAMFLLDAMVNSGDATRGRDTKRDSPWLVFSKCMRELLEMDSANLKRTWKDIVELVAAPGPSNLESSSGEPRGPGTAPAVAFDCSWVELLLLEAFNHPNTEFRAFALRGFSELRDDVGCAAQPHTTSDESCHVEYSASLLLDGVASSENLQYSLTGRPAGGFDGLLRSILSSCTASSGAAGGGSSFRGAFLVLLGRVLALLARGADHHKLGSRLLDSLLGLGPELLSVAEINSAAADQICACLETMAAQQRRDAVFAVAPGGAGRKLVQLLCACRPERTWCERSLAVCLGRLRRAAVGERSDPEVSRLLHSWAEKCNIGAACLSELLADHLLSQQDDLPSVELSHSWVLLAGDGAGAGAGLGAAEGAQDRVLLAWCRAWSGRAAAGERASRLGHELVVWLTSALRLARLEEEEEEKEEEEGVTALDGGAAVCLSQSRTALAHCLASQPLVPELCSWSARDVLGRPDLAASLLWELHELAERAPAALGYGADKAEITSCICDVTQRVLAELAVLPPRQQSEADSDAAGDKLWAAAALLAWSPCLARGSCDALVAAAFADAAAADPPVGIFYGLSPQAALDKALFLEAAALKLESPNAGVAACERVLLLQDDPDPFVARCYVQAAAARALGALDISTTDVLWRFLEPRVRGWGDSVDDRGDAARAAAEELVLAVVRAVFSHERCSNPNAKPDLQRFWSLLASWRLSRIVMVRHVLFSALAGPGGGADPAVVDLWVPELAELLLFPAHNLAGLRGYDSAVGDLCDLGTYTRYLALQFCQTVAAPRPSWVKALATAAVPLATTVSPQQVSALEAICVLCRALDSVPPGEAAGLRAELFAALIDDESLESFKGEALSRYYLELAVTQLLWSDAALLVPRLLAMLREPDRVGTEKEMSAILVIGVVIHHWRQADAAFWRAALEDVVTTLLPYLSSSTVQGREFAQVLVHFLLSSELAIVGGSGADRDQATPAAARVRALPEVQAVLARIASSRTAELALARITTRTGKYDPPQRVNVQHLFSFLVSSHARAQWLEAWFAADAGGAGTTTRAWRAAGRRSCDAVASPVSTVPSPALLEAHRSGDGPITGTCNGTMHEGIILASLVEKVPNAGGLTRTCEMFSLKELVLSDTNFAKEKLFKEMAASANLWCRAAQLSFSDIPNYMRRAKARGYRIVVLEQSASSVCITKYKFPPDGKVVFLLGTEKHGVPSHLLNAVADPQDGSSAPLVDDCVEIPQFGLTRSLNVHVSAAILVHEYLKQQQATRDSALLASSAS